MKVAILGNGGREHAICHILKESKKVSKIYSIPGNAGTSFMSENINIDLSNFDELKEFIIESKIDLVVVGPEKPLVDGVVDFLNENNIRVFGPNKAASQLEGSKTFTKLLCKENNIPTANYGIFKKKESAADFINKSIHPLVVKADGLAAGKGVYICENIKQSLDAIHEIFGGKFGKTKIVLIEEFLDGEEMSFFIIADGKNYKKFGTAQDHKRVNEGDKGKNTGGMGSYSPSRLENKILDEKIINKIIKPTLAGLNKMNISFSGFLYAGLMIVKGEPFLIEYNVRMGDPECQTILPRLKSDFADIILSCVEQKLSSSSIEWHNDKSICIVLCSKGYPDKFDNNVEIKELEKLKLNNKEYIFHAGTKKKDSVIISNGGRVLNFVVRCNDFKSGRDNAIKLLNQLNWVNGFFRKDIGYKVIN
tara:strand:- start:229 stop:1491 length:1263 start_codon:yes stop_codon:yes gene_type:complete